jgi:predicted  nucleic acid-binding Zn-ribbon protein
LHNNLVFIYGKKVDDLHHLKKDSIWTVAAAALQEVDRQQQSDKVRIAELETEVATLKNQVFTFETQMSELLSRVSSLENSDNTTTTTDDS